MKVYTHEPSFVPQSGPFEPPCVFLLLWLHVVLRYRLVYERPPINGLLLQHVLSILGKHEDVHHLEPITSRIVLVLTSFLLATQIKTN